MQHAAETHTIPSAQQQQPMILDFACVVKIAVHPVNIKRSNVQEDMHQSIQLAQLRANLLENIGCRYNLC